MSSVTHTSFIVQWTFTEEILVSSSGSSMSQTVWTPTLKGGVNILFGQIMHENCMKMKEIGPGGGYVPCAPLDPPMVSSDQTWPFQSKKYRDYQWYQRELWTSVDVWLPINGWWKLSENITFLKQMLLNLQNVCPFRRVMSSSAI